MEQKENQRVAVTKRMLQEALLSLLAQKYINEISVSELCRKAGINRATFYRHYNTPNDILSAMGQTYADHLMAIQEEYCGPRDTLVILEESCRYLYAQRDVLRILLRNGMNDSAAAQAFAEIFRQSAVSHVVNLAGMDKTAQKLVVTYLSNGCFSLLKQWLMEDIRKSPQEIATLLHTIFSRGWLPR